MLTVSPALPREILRDSGNKSATRPVKKSLTTFHDCRGNFERKIASERSLLAFDCSVNNGIVHNNKNLNLKSESESHWPYVNARLRAVPWKSLPTRKCW